MNAATTNGSTKITPAAWFTPIAGAALIWNLMGVAAFISQMMTDLSILPEAQRAYYASIPLWATAAFAIAVFAGAAGSTGLLLKKRWAFPVLIVSFIGILVQLAHSLLLGNGVEVFGRSALILPLLTLAIGLALIGLADLAKKRNWI